MPDLIPAKDGIVDRHPEGELRSDTGFRVKPGMTKIVTGTVLNQNRRA